MENNWKFLCELREGDVFIFKNNPDEYVVEQHLFKHSLVRHVQTKIIKEEAPTTIVLKVE